MNEHLIDHAAELRRVAEDTFFDHDPDKAVTLAAADEIERLRRDRDELVAAARSVDGVQAHQILPALWPVIQRMAHDKEQ